MLSPRQGSLAGILSLLTALVLLCAAFDAGAADATSPQAAPSTPPALKSGRDSAPQATSQPPAQATPPDEAVDSTASDAPAENLFSPTFQSCMDEAAGVNTAMQDCMNAELERLEKHLAAQRPRVVSALSGERAAALEEALKAWEHLRKQGSAAMFDPDGGSLAPLMASLWYLEQTGRMARWLDSIQEGVAP